MSIRQGEVSHKEQTLLVNRLLIIWIFAFLLQARNRPVGITRGIRSRVILATNVSHIISTLIKYIYLSYTSLLSVIVYYIYIGNMF